jgi:16S rRNA processing protein RimM
VPRKKGDASSSSPRLASLATPLPQGERGRSIRVARIGAAHGIRGEVRLWPFTEDQLAVADYGPLETEDGARAFEIESVRPGKGFLVARIAGVQSRDAAEALRNTDLFVPRARLPAIEEEDTFYHADLIGLAAVTAEGESVGTVSAVHNFGAGDIIEIAPTGGGQTLMLPFTQDAVPEVDLKAKRIVVVVPASPPNPPLKGEDRPPKRSKGGRGEVNSGDLE